MKRNSFVVLVCVALLMVSCRASSKPSAQAGPLVGRWIYLGSDLQRPDEGIVRSFVIGDHTWWIPKETEFFGSGEVSSGYDQRCNFDVRNDHQVEVDCHQGRVTIEYSIRDSMLTLNLQGKNTALTGGGPQVSFKRSE